MPEKKLYLIDGHALAYRAYFAFLKTPLTTSRGQPTGAVFGFATWVLRLKEQFDCPFLAVVLDSAVPTFRHEVYADYKAHREKMPDDMQTQMPLILRLIDALGIPAIRKDGLEADDLMATLAKRAASEGFEVCLVTKDKDLMQLVGPHVCMLAPESGGNLDLYDPAKVTGKFGVPPEKIRDLLALMGDASDNIPGVPGVGPKTAVKLLEKAGTVQALIDDPSLAGNPKLETKIRENLDKIILSRELVTLREDCDCGCTLDELQARPLDVAKARAFLEEMEFKSLLRNPVFDRTTRLSIDVTIPDGIDAVQTFADRIRKAGFVSVDTETTSTDPRDAELVGISLAVDEKSAMYIPVGHADSGRNLVRDDVLARIGPLMEDASIAKIGQNLKYDAQILRSYGITMHGIAFDTMVAAYCIDPGRRQYGMDTMAAEWLEVKTTPIEKLIGKGKNQISFADVPIDKAAAYSSEDVVVPLLLKDTFEPLLVERGLQKLFREIEIPLVPVLAGMEWHGACLDTDLLADLSTEYSRRIDGLTREIHDLAGGTFNINSTQQLAEVLFEKLKLPRSRKTKTGLSTDVRALEKLAEYHPIVAKILEYREFKKLLSTYIDALPRQLRKNTGRLHTSFNQTVAATGRLSSAGPNLQNIPVRTDEGRKIREAFAAPEGCVLISADYSQIELRILAHLSQDSALLQAFADNQDIHTQTASAIYGGIMPAMVTSDMRRVAKTINFGLMYGMGPMNLSQQLKISFKEARRFIDVYFQQFPAIRGFMDRSIAQARESGFTETLLGRRRYLPDINASSRQVREAAERTAINTPVQGTAADIIKIAMINIHAEVGAAFPRAAMILQVHDELVFEVPEKQGNAFRTWVVEKMSGAYRLDVPLKVDAGVGEHWGAAH